MPMMDVPMMTGDQVVVERRVEESGNRGLSPIIPPPTSDNAQPPVVYHFAQALADSRQGPIKATFALCKAMPSYSNASEHAADSAIYVIQPTEANELGRLHSEERIELNGDEQVALTKGPKHGKLLPPVGEDVLKGWRYTPELGFVGTDRVEFIVKGRDELLGEVEFKLIYSIKVTSEKRLDYVRNPYMSDKYCPNRVKQIYFKDNLKVGPLSLADMQPLSTWMASQLHSDSSSLPEAGAMLPAEIRYEIADLDGAAVGGASSAGSSASAIILDPTAAGHGWFIDSTPGDNEEFLATRNPNEWIAKEGSAAYGKMDMLSVFLHEYGHVLGIEHSHDAHDFMATTLQPGVRRTLTVDEQLQLMALAGYFPVPDSPSQPYGPTDPGVPLPFTRTNASRFGRVRPLAGQEDTAVSGNVLSD